MDGDLARKLWPKIKMAKQPIVGIHEVWNVSVGHCPIWIWVQAENEWRLVELALAIQNLKLPKPKVNWNKWAKGKGEFWESKEWPEVRNHTPKIILGLDVERLTWKNGDEVTHSQMTTYPTKLGWMISGLASGNESCNMAEAEVLEQLLVEFHHFNDFEGIHIEQVDDSLSFCEKQDLEFLKERAHQLPDLQWEIPTLINHHRWILSLEPKALARLKKQWGTFKKAPTLKVQYEERLRMDVEAGYV